MTKAELFSKVNRGLHNVGFQIKKHSPAILVGAGVVGIVASTVLACKATTKLEGILHESQEKVEKIHTCMEDKELVESGKYTEKDAKKDLTIIYTQTGMKLVKLYAPAILLGAASITGIFASHHILTKRNVALSAAYAVIDKNFKDYRKNVKQRFGDKVDFELRHNIKAEQIDVVETDEKGKEKVKKETVEVADCNKEQYSDYAIFFDETNPNWNRDPEYNKMFLKLQERYANDKLKANGYLFLNEVYEMIGHPRTKAGQVVGWVYNPKNPVGDNFVDFGMYDINKRRAQDFINGYEKSILLDFNVDGNIWQLMP